MKDQIKFYCNSCGSMSRQEILFEHKAENEVDYPQGKSYENHTLSEDTHQLLSCSGCGAVSYRILSHYPNFMSTDDDGNMVAGSNTVETVYPERKDFKHEIQNIRNFPQNLGKLYREIVNAFNERKFILVTQGLNLLLSGIAHHFSGKEEAKKEDEITQLKNSGRLGKDLAESLKVYSFLVENLEKSFEVPEEQELRKALELMEQTMFSLFDVPSSHDELKRGITKRIVGDE